MILGSNYIWKKQTKIRKNNRFYFYILQFFNTSQVLTLCNFSKKKTRNNLTLTLQALCIKTNWKYVHQKTRKLAVKNLVFFFFYQCYFCVCFYFANLLELYKLKQSKQRIKMKKLCMPYLKLLFVFSFFYRAVFWRNLKSFCCENTFEKCICWLP